MVRPQRRHPRGCRCHSPCGCRPRGGTSQDSKGDDVGHDNDPRRSHQDDDQGSGRDTNNAPEEEEAPDVDHNDDEASRQEAPGFDDNDHVAKAARHDDDSAYSHHNHHNLPATHNHHNSTGHNHDKTEASDYDNYHHHATEADLIQRDVYVRWRRDSNGERDWSVGVQFAHG